MSQQGTPLLSLKINALGVPPLRAVGVSVVWGGPVGLAGPALCGQVPRWLTGKPQGALGLKLAPWWVESGAGCYPLVHEARSWG